MIYIHSPGKFVNLEFATKALQNIDYQSLAVQNLFKIIFFTLFIHTQVESNGTIVAQNQRGEKYVSLNIRLGTGSDSIALLLTV